MHPGLWPVHMYIVYITHVQRSKTLDVHTGEVPGSFVLCSASMRCISSLFSASMRCISRIHWPPQALCMRCADGGAGPGRGAEGGTWISPPGRGVGLGPTRRAPPRGRFSNFSFLSACCCAHCCCKSKACGCAIFGAFLSALSAAIVCRAAG